MLRVPLFDDWDLLLSPRWAGLAPAAQAALLVLLGLAPVLLVLWLYRWELRLVPRLTALALLGLRLTAVVLLWLLVALQPVVARSTTEELPGRVLVAVDRSASTGIPDPQRSVPDKLRLARALKLQTSEGRPPAALLDAWIRHYEEHGTKAPPPWVGRDDFAGDPGARRLLADQQKAWHDGLCREVDKLTRADVARLLLAGDGAGLLGALRARHEVELRGFHQEAWEVPPERLDDLFRPGGPHGKPRGDDVLYLGAGCTDLGGPLARALEPAPDRGRVLGVLLLTDGQHNRGPSPVKKAAELGGRNIPVFPVALGTRQPPQDIVLSEVRAPTNVFKDMEVPVEATFKVTGLAAQDIKVELHRPGLPPGKEDVKTVRHDGTDRSYAVHFQANLGQAGTHTLTVKVRPASDKTKEITTENNSRTAVVRAAGDRIRVLLIDGEARWEYHYLSAALRRDPAVAADAVVFVQPRLQQVAEAELEKAGNPRLKLPQKKAREDPLSRYDCIILGDVAPGQLPTADRRRLERYVADRGGTLVLLAGKRYLPLGFLAERGPGGATDPLLKLLPVEGPHAVNPPAGLAVRLTAEGNAAPFLQLDPAPDASARLWAELPRHYWGAVGRAKPGASVLAFVPGGPAGAKGKDGPERTRALIAQQNYGSGRVLYVGLDSTWRWRYRVGDLYHHRFWGQVVRWAAADRLLPAGNRHVRFGTREPVYRRGNKVDVAARLAEDLDLLPPGARVSARIVRQDGGGKERVVPLTPAPNQPRLLQGQALDLPVGKYRVALDIPHLAEKLKVPPEKGDAGPDLDAFAVLPPEAGEMNQLATNWALLEAVAAASHGEVLTPETAGRVLDRLAARVVRRERRDEQRLWQDVPLVWGVLGVFLVLLTLEWAARKLSGLP
jgi:hypothetical protein